MNRSYGNYSIKEIAQELGLSRNTVSKALNSKPGISARTRQLVLKCVGEKTREAGIGGFDARPRPGADTIMFSYRLENIEYINGLLSGIEYSIRENGYLLVVNIIPADAQKPYFPPSVYNRSICGIISFNIYDDDYWNEVLSLGLPAVFLESGYRLEKYAGKVDIISQENTGIIYSMVRMLYQSGRRDFAFFGYPYYCNSLYHRWNAFNAALGELGLTANRQMSILDDFSKADDRACLDAVRARLERAECLPDTYVCASDRQAILLMRAMREMGIDVPGRVAVTGFDNVPESARQLPPLSTVDANTEYQGSLAVRKLLERIADPGKPHEYIEVETTPVIRESSGRREKRENDVERG